MATFKETSVFQPYRGTEEAIAQMERKDGNLLFAWDTGKIYLDTATGRYSMGAAGGAAFLYSNASVAQMDEYFTLPYDSIDAEKVTVDDIVVSGDNVICRVNTIDIEKNLVYVTPLASGGAGGAGSGRILTVKARTEWPTSVIPTMPINAVYSVSSNMSADTEQEFEYTISVDLYSTADTTQKLETIYTYTNYGYVDVPFEMTIPANTFVSGNYVTKIAFVAKYGEGEDQSTASRTRTVSKIYNISFGPNPNSWNERKQFTLSGSNSGIQFGYNFTGIDSDIPGWIKTYINEVPIKESSQTFISTSSSFDISAADLSNAGIGHGSHTFKVEGYVVIGGVKTLVQTLLYNIMLIDPSSDVPIIISPYIPPEGGELNYSIINIPYMVYQKGVSNPYVRLYINGALDNAVNITTTENTYENWEIVKYDVTLPDGINTFRISCGDTIKTFEIPVIETDETRKLNPITDGLILDLSTYGRSNNESSKARQTWTYTNAFGDTYSAVFKNFNWYNNGWVNDSNTGGNTALRITNGASLHIPFQEIFYQDVATECTIEIDMKPRNIIEFARLITTEQIPVYEKGEEGDTVDKDGNKLDENGNKIPVKDKYGNQEYDMKNTIHTEKGVLCKYYNGTAGFCIGTQEAFMTTDKTLVNIRYAENQKVKITFVVDILKQTAGSAPEGVLYAYVNGVMSGAARFTGDKFLSGSDALIFNSDYCDLDIYRIKIYNRALDYGEITQNWAADAPTLQEKQSRYKQNGAIVKTTSRTNSHGDKISDTIIDFEALRYSDDNTIPIMVLTTYPDENADHSNGTVYQKLPFNKADGSEIFGDVRLYHPLYNGKTKVNGVINPNKGFRAQRVEIAVQGTSSQGYPRRNYKIKIKGPKAGKSVAFTWGGVTYDYMLQEWDGEEYNVKNNIWNGATIKKYNMSLLGDDLSETPFCLKADYMESSSTHNTGLANFVQNVSTKFETNSKDYNLRHPLVRMGHMDNGDARTTVYGYPILLFWDKKGSNEPPEFIGKYNFNLDKGATDVFGFTNGATHDYLTDKTYEDVAECWELLNNKGTRCSFRTNPDNFFDVDENGHLQVLSDFEQRYCVSDFDFEEMYADAAAATDPAAAVVAANNEIKGYMDNLFTLYKWIYSTDASPDRVTGAQLPAGSEYWNKTQDVSYEAGKNYYYINGDLSHYIVYTQDDYGATLTETNNGDVTTYRYELSTRVVQEDVKDEVGNVIDTIDVTENYYAYSMNGVADPSKDIEVLSELVPDLSWYEYYDKDTSAYRLAKFKNEFDKHLNKAYCLFYYILTNVLIMFDSRSKNMMLASWGPEEEGGDYIWYPIFYDMDTQLGVNNSGVVYWDYDCEPDDYNNEFDGPIYSGASSVLWKNIHLCFQEAAQNMYRQLRSQGLLSKETLMKYYQIDGSNQWSEAMKNADAFFKYVAPALSVSDGYGYIDQSGQKKGDDYQYLYCMQGDRALLQEALFVNRLNYKDSQWGAGSYQAGIQGGSQIQLRYNANASGTSDPTKGTTASDSPLESDATFDLETYLTQYCTVFLDVTPIRPFKRYDAIKGVPVAIEPPKATQEAIRDGSDLQQQLIYIYGPEYVKSLGDLSTKYLDELKIAQATRLRELRLGSDYTGYNNSRMSKEENLVLGSSEGSSLAKQLLSYLDLTNLKQYTGNIDIGGCIKLETLKCLGTQASSVVLPKGSIFHTVYLPGTVQALLLLAPQSLTEVIHDNTLVGYNARINNGGIEHPGLYIEGITDAIKIGDDGVYTYTAPATTAIGDFRTDSTKLMFETYVLLKMLTEVRWNEYASNKNKTLLINMQNVEWTPYKKLEIDADYNSYVGQTLYYPADNQTYAAYVPSTDFATGGNIDLVKWTAALKGRGVYVKDSLEKYDLLGTNAVYNSELSYYTKNSETGAYDTYTYNSGTWANDLISKNIYRKITIQNPIADLSLLQYYTVTDLAHGCLKDTDTSSNKIPTITGSMHVNNTQNTKLDEYELYNTYKLAFPNLEITADYITECNRTKFIEYAPDGSIVTYGIFKTNNPSAVITPPTWTEDNPAPAREHYDFHGWTTEDISSTNCVVPVEQLSSMILYKDKADFASQTFASNPVYYAVFALHGYTVTIVDELDNSKILGEVVITSGEKIGTNLDRIEPSRDSSTLDMENVWAFRGYKRVLTGVITDITNVTVNEDMVLYAVFEEDSIYNVPLTNDKIKIMSKDGTNAAVGLATKMSGKICFPATVEEDGKIYTITSIWGNASDATPNNISKNTELTHVFFAKDSQVNQFDQQSFTGCTNLLYVEIPESLRIISARAFNQCAVLTFNNFKNVYSFGQNALANRYSGSFNNPSYADSGEVRIGGGALDFYNNAFKDTGYSHVIMGTNENPVTAITYVSSNGTAFNNNPNMTMMTVILPEDADDSLITEIENFILDDLVDPSNASFSPNVKRAYS